MSVFFVIIFWAIFIINIAKKKNEREEKERKMEEEALKKKTPSPAKPAASATRSPKDFPDPICENYQLSRDALLRLHQSGSLTEEAFFEANCQLYDTYMKQPMEICRFLRRIGISTQGRVLDNGDYTVEFLNEDAAWSASRLLNASRETTLVSAEQRSTSTWAYLPFESSAYRLTLLVDRHLGTYKLVVRNRNAAGLKSLSQDELDLLQTGAFDFTH